VLNEVVSLEVRARSQIIINHQNKLLERLQEINDPLFPQAVYDAIVQSMIHVGIVDPTFGCLPLSVQWGYVAGCLRITFHDVYERIVLKRGGISRPAGIQVEPNPHAFMYVSVSAVKPELQMEMMSLPKHDHETVELEIIQHTLDAGYVDPSVSSGLSPLFTEVIDQLHNHHDFLLRRFAHVKEQGDRDRFYLELTRGESKVVIGLCYSLLFESFKAFEEREMVPLKNPV
jgi:hypothetical protein